MKKITPILFLLMLVAVVVTASQSAQGAANGLVVATDKPLYAPGDTVDFKIFADSASGSLTGDLVLRVYPPAWPDAANAFAAAPVFETVISKDFSLTGPTGAGYQAKLSDLKAGGGGYPVKVSLIQNGAEVLWGTTWLAVTDGAGHEPLDLVMLWTASSPPQRNANGVFIDTGLLERCRANSQAADNLLQHLAFAQKYPQIKTSYAFEPALLDQLGDLGDGFELKEGEEASTFNAASPEAGSAKACLESLRKLALSANTEIVSAPYSFVSLPILARQGWDDGYGQFRVGHDVLTQALELPTVPKGTYAPRLDITTDSLRYLAATGGEYVVLSGGSRAHVQGRGIGSEVDYRLRDLSGERIAGFFANDAASVALLGKEPDPNAFFAVLVNSYLSAEPNRLVIAASSLSTPAIGIEQRDRVYNMLNGLSWVHGLTFDEARQKYRPETQPATLLKYEDPLTGYVVQTYYQKLDAVHTPFEAYRVAVDNDEPELVRLTRMMYTAENSYWMDESANPDDANRGMDYLSEIDRSVKGEIEGLDISIDTPFMQRAANGAATVKIVNDNVYAFTLDVAVEGDEGVSFPEGSERRVRVESGTMEFTVPYHSETWSRLDTRARSHGYTMVEDGAGIHPIAGRIWIAIFIIMAGLALAAAYIFLVVRRR